MAQTIARPGEADLRMIDVAIADVEVVKPSILLEDLDSGHSLLLPFIARIRAKDRVPRVLGPVESILAGGVADGIRFILLPSGIPHSPLFLFLFPKNMRAHYRDVFPRYFRCEDFGSTRPLDAVIADDVPDCRLSIRIPVFC